MKMSPQGAMPGRSELPSNLVRILKYFTPIRPVNSALSILLEFEDTFYKSLGQLFALVFTMAYNQSFGASNMMLGTLYLPSSNLSK